MENKKNKIDRFSFGPRSTPPTIEEMSEIATSLARSNFTYRILNNPKRGLSRNAAKKIGRHDYPWANVERALSEAYDMAQIKTGTWSHLRRRIAIESDAKDELLRLDRFYEARQRRLKEMEAASENDLEPLKERVTRFVANIVERLVSKLPTKIEINVICESRKDDRREKSHNQKVNK